ncbi:hypothetical protein [Tepidicaulis sp.]|uniref:hypothetical protein n=1 Tax=Tepidicaulis sp. TaxID=1920809 RepID=UPI003B5A993C
MKSILFSVHSIFFVRCTKTGGELGFSPTLPGKKFFTAKADSPLEGLEPAHRTATAKAPQGRSPIPLVFPRGEAQCE